MEQIKQELWEQFSTMDMQTPLFSHAAYRWLYSLIERDEDRSDVIALVLEEVQQQSEWMDETTEYENDEYLDGCYEEVVALLEPYLERLALLK